MVAFLPINKETGYIKVRLNELMEKQKSAVDEEEILKVQIALDSLQNVLDSFLVKTYPEEELTAFGRFLETAVRQSGMSLVAIKPDYTYISRIKDTKEGVASFPMKIKVKGEFYQLTSFLDAIPSFSFIIRLGGIIIEKEDMARSTVNVEIQGIVVLRKEGAYDNIRQSKELLNRI